MTRKDAANATLSQVTYTYDAHGRQSSATDLRNGTTSFNYDDSDRRIAMTTPPPGTGQPAQTTGYQYDYAGRVTVVSHPDGTSPTNQYEPTGLLSSRAGARSYPVEYRYDAQGRMTNLITWQDHAQDAGCAVTRWEYDPKRGFLVRKTYADTNSFILYTNTPAGRLHSRTWARGITTTYSTNAAGETIGITYSDPTTPGVTYNLDRLGRHTNVVDGAGSRFLTYDEDGGILSVTNASGVLAGLKVEYEYDSIGRRTNTLFFTNNAAAVLAHGYTYDAASRLRAVSDGTYSAAYSYLANSSLIDSISYDDGPNTRMTAPRTYDHLGRLQRIAATPTSGLRWDFDYTYNQANQRVRTAHRDGSAWQYDYDGLGQLTSGRKHWADGLWDYTWDGENRLIEMKSDAGVPTAAVKWLVFAYDSQGRRISKSVSNWNGGWSLEGLRTFAYDDWNLLAELDGEDNVFRSFLWGTDLSGSMPGAGSVGGLLAVDDSEEGCHFAAYDGNGNVVGLVDATDGAPSAFYEYDPFGQRIRCSGDAASINPFQFSTKYLDPETGFSYYGHRYYNTSTGRWLSRDPIGELGHEVALRAQEKETNGHAELLPEGPTLYAFVGNSPIAKIDVHGLWSLCAPKPSKLGCIEFVGCSVSQLADFRVIPGNCSGLKRWFV